MFFTKTKKSSHYTLSLFICALVLTGIGYAFVQHLENMYHTQARIILHNAASSIAQSFSVNLSETQEYIDLMARTFEKETSTEKTIAERLQTVEKLSERFPFAGIITEDNELHVGRHSGISVQLDSVTKRQLLQTGKEKPLYTLVYINGVGEYYLFYTSHVSLPSGKKGVLFTGKKHAVMSQKLLSQTMRKSIQYAILDSNGNVLEDTFPAIDIGENILTTWENSLENSPKTLTTIRQNLKTAQPYYTKLSCNSEVFFVEFAPTTQQEWTVLVSMTQNTVEERLERTTYALIITGCSWFIFCILVLLHVLRSEHREKKTSELTSQRLQWLFDEIPAGVVHFKDDEHWTISEYGESFLRTFNITQQELEHEYKNSWLEFIFPADRAHVQQTLQSATENAQKTVIIEYRIQPKGKDIMWVLETARTMNDSEGRWFWSILTNITERKKKEIHEHKMAERYRYLFESSQKILYEYDWNKQELRTTRQFFKKFGYPIPKEKTDYYSISTESIHPDDMDLFNSMQAKLRVGGTSAEALLRIKKADNTWIWCQLRQSAWVDINDSTTKAIGEIKNVDEETRSLQKLRDDVQRDSFTGLYNKTATAELISQETSLHTSERGVLCIIDVDNFKQVNDNLGHAVGDIVIKNLAAGLASIFRSDDIVGRVGGDEYIVYIKNMPNLGVLLVKLDKVIEYFNQTLEGEGVQVHISCSIGIALFPANGKSYQELYTHADKALYRSKKKKGIYTFYDPNIDA